MAIYRIRHCERLSGEVWIHSAKNAVLPLMCAGLLTREPITIENVPGLTDVETLLDILAECGVHVQRDGQSITLWSEVPCSPTSENLLSHMRASVLVMGPLLARTGYARVALPGGCAIGQRPIDLHIKGLEALGAQAQLTSGAVTLQGKLRGGSVYLDFPSVGATENILLASVLADGHTRIENAAKEPEIIDLCMFLRQMGAEIEGVGTGTLYIKGHRQLHGCVYRPIPDRIEAGTILCAAAMTDGSVLLRNVCPEHMRAVLFKLKEAGVTLRESSAGLRISGRAIHPFQVRTLAYPGFPTDMQPQISTALCLAGGTSSITEGVYDNRFRYVAELRRMGAQGQVDGKVCVIEGTDGLVGAPVKACDLRAGAAMVIAGLAAQGTTVVEEVHHIERGYENIIEKLRGLGADISRIEVPEPTPVGAVAG